jgi:Tol biopolymer transport system component
VWLTDASSDHRAPSWSADGEWVYFASNRGGRWEIWKASLRSKEGVQVTRHGGGYSQKSPDGKFIYYQKPIANRIDSVMLPEIWRMPSGGGPEEVVLNVNNRTQSAADNWFWRATTQGIYFVDNSARPSALLKLFSFTSRTTRTLRQLEKQVWGNPGLAVSPDGRNVLIGQMDGAGSDIMLIENFH